MKRLPIRTDIVNRINVYFNHFTSFRTNPRYSGRSSYGTAANIGVVKPTLIDVGNDNDISTATAMPVRSGDSLNESGADLKHYDDVWTVTERRKNLPNRWKNAQSVDVNVQQNQQEIIEQQKREILRLLKENEELKKHVASSQQNTNSTHISIEHENGDVQPVSFIP
ncbi:unnamed protein product [Anisakis simplex]|uniref:Uncharacterized protein n=1 Tax=Anisakis simplex TaxID=6269 RepID=A0A0M3J991_ANISI|nr:unnamed protein product [Anisakis simplex]